MIFTITPISGALVCSSEVCRAGAVCDAHAISRGEASTEVLEMLEHARREAPNACAYCGLVRFEAYRRAK